MNMCVALEIMLNIKYNLGSAGRLTGRPVDIP